MILITGEKYKMGSLVEVLRDRFKEDEIEFIPPSDNILKHEIPILRFQDVKYIIYDATQYYNEGVEIADVIKRIYRANKAMPIIVAPTENPKNEIVKSLIDRQLKNIVNISLSAGSQKEQLEKILSGFYEYNKREDIEEIEKEVAEDNKRLNEFVEELYDAKIREDKKEKTVIVNTKKNTEIAIDLFKSILRTAFTVISVVLMSIALITLIYSSTRSELFKVLESIYMEVLEMLNF